MRRAKNFSASSMLLVQALSQILLPLIALICHIPRLLMKPGMFLRPMDFRLLSVCRDARCSLYIDQQSVQVKTVKSDPLHTNRNLYQIWPNLGVEPVGVHTEIAGSVPQSDESWQDWLTHGGTALE
jgi:hypothetical protein